MFKRLLSKVQESAWIARREEVSQTNDWSPGLSVQVPSGSLQESLVAPRLAVHLGVPDKASVLAYDEVQRLLAIGTRDGRIKIFGGDGVEGLLLSPSKAPCKYLAFFPNKGFLVHVTTHDHIEVWDLDKRQLSASCKWDCIVTAIAIAPGTSFMYIGDETGTCRILQHDAKTGFLRPMAYCIPPHITLGGLVRPGSSAPSLVGILPQPTATHSRLLLGYDNGVMILWGLHDQRALVIRGGTKFKLAKLAEHARRVAEMDGSGAGRGPELNASENLGSDDDEDDMDLCSLCWACASGSIAAAGYTSGDVWLWSFPSPGKGVSVAGDKAGSGSGKDRDKEREKEAAVWAPSGVPLQRIQLAQRAMRMPITALRWCSTTGTPRGGGRLYVLGGGAFETPEMVSVLALHTEPAPIPRRELPWFGPVADVALAPVAGGTAVGQACAVMVLTSPGQVHVFDEVEVAALFQEATEGPTASPTPVHVQSALVDSMITASAIWCFSADATAIDLLTSLPQGSVSYFPSSLAGGSKWPITGGVASATARGSVGAKGKSSVLFTGHRNGIVSVWDASSPMLPCICKVPSEYNKEKGELDGTSLHEVTALDFCSVSGLLCIAQQQGVVRLYSLSKERRQVMRHTIDENCAIKREKISAAPGFQCVAVLKIHKATVRSMAIASGVSRLALGSDDGVVSVLDLSAFTLLYHDKPLPTTPVPIVSLFFVPVLPSSDSSPSAARSSTSPTTPRGSMLSRPSSFRNLASLLFVAAKNSTMVIFDASKGQPSGAPVQPKNPSPCVAIFPLDATGSLVKAPAGPESLPWLTGDGEGSNSAPGSPARSLSGSRPSSPDAKSKPATLSRENSVRSIRSGSGSESESAMRPPTLPFSEAAYVLLCSYDCLRLYPIASLLQGERATARKVKLASGFVPCWASMFGIQGIFPQGLALLSPSGDLDVRSLPDLAEVKSSTLSDSLGWQYEPSNSNLQLSSATPDGRLLVIEGESEFICMSLIATENALGLPQSLPSLHDDVLAAAADAAELAIADHAPPSSAAGVPAATPLETRDSKKKGFFGAISRDLGSAIKTVAGGAHAGGRPGGPAGTSDEHSSTDHTSTDLSSLFLTRPFTAVALSQNSGSAGSRGAMTREASGADTISSMSFDEDFDLQDDASSTSSSLKPRLSYTRADSHGKDKGGAESEADARSQLFGGASKTAVPHQRTAAEIRAAYGHGRKTTDAGGAAAMARDKLMERQEKLENVSRRTAEMQQNAESFAAMAEELTKKMEKKGGWW